jgi:hypothetical protein
MRYRLIASYRGVLYQAGLGPDGTEATLFCAGPPATESGFAAADGHWRKQVSIGDLDALWQSRPVGDYGGEPCLVLDDLGERLHIAYLGRDAARAAQLGYWEIDRKVFEVVVARHDVANLTEERVDLPLTAATFPSSRAKHAIQASAPGPTARTPDRVTAWHGSPAAEPWPEAQAAADARPDPGRGPATVAPADQRTGHKDRISPESVFAELLTLSAISQASYAVDDEVPGAMCLVKANGGFEVFSRTEDARLEVRFFEDEEAAYFYLFGVLAAEAIRSGRLRPTWPGEANGHKNSSGALRTSSAASENVSKYLRAGNLPTSPSRPARVYLAGGADGPPLPKQPRRPPRSSSSQKHRAYHKTVILSLPANRRVIHCRFCLCFSGF